MTPLELRLMQLFSREGGRLVARIVSTRTSRYSAEQRNLALQMLEAQGLIGSAVEPTNRGGRDGGGRLVYWLTPAGQAWAKDARARGEIRDKSAGKRAAR